MAWSKDSSWLSDLQMVATDDNNRFIIEKEGENELVVIGRNPSYGTLQKPDKTMKRVCYCAEHTDFDGILLCNVCAQRFKQKKDSTLHRYNREYIKQYIGRLSAPTILLILGTSVFKTLYLKQYLQDIISDICNLKGCKPKWKCIKFLDENVPCSFDKFSKQSKVADWKDIADIQQILQ